MFWDSTKKWFWTGMVIALVIWGAATIISISVDRTERYQHDVLAALMHREDLVRSYPEAHDAAEKVRQIVEFSEDEIDSMPARGLGYVRVAPRREFEDTKSVFAPMYASPDSATLATMLQTAGTTATLGQRPWDSFLASFAKGDSLKMLQPLSVGIRATDTVVTKIIVLRNGYWKISELLASNPGLVAQAYLGRLPVEKLPSDAKSPLFPPLFLFIAWCVVGVLTIFAYAYDSDGDDSWISRYRWSTLGPWVVVLIFLPGVLLVLLITAVVYSGRGIHAALTFDWGAWTAKRLERQRRRKLLDVFLPVPPPAPIQEAMHAEPEGNGGNGSAPEPPVEQVSAPVEKPDPEPQWYYIEGFDHALDHLLDNGIPARDFAIKEQGGSTGIVFPANRVREAERVLETRFNTQEAWGSSREGVFVLLADKKGVARLNAERTFRQNYAKARSAYVELARGRLTHEIDDAVRQRRRLLDEQQGYARRITESEREIRYLQDRESMIRAAMDNRLKPEWLEREFDKIASLPEVSRIEVRDGTLSVYTRPLFAEEEVRHTGEVKYFDFGEFEIRIMQANGDIRMINLTTKGRDGIDHPQLRDGYGCLGNLREGLSVHIGRYEYYIAVQMLLRFLTNDAAGGYAAGGWKEVPREVARPALPAANGAGNGDAIPADPAAAVGAA